MKIFQEFDFLSQKVSLTINDKGDTAYKTFMGGIISIFAVLISIGVCFYFILRMYYKKDMSIILSTEINQFVNLTDSHKLPFLFKLTDTNSIDYDEDERLYYMTMSVWFGGSNDTSMALTASQYKQSLNVGKCDLNKHFDIKFRKYFENFKNLNSYYCIEPRNYSQTIYGLYGSYYPFSYYSFTLRYCANTTENNNTCYSINEIKEKFATPYLDFIFLDYTIDSMNAKNVENISIRKERFELSAKLYKRVYIYLENIEFKTDDGFIFTKNEKKNFYRYNAAKIDTNIYDSPVIATLSVMNSINTSTFHKKYTKFQDYLATIGGLIKVISLLGNALNYFNAENSYYLRIFKDFVIENQEFHHKIKKNNSSITSNKLKLNLVNNFSDISKSNICINISQDNNSNKKENIRFNELVSYKFFPSFFIKNDVKIILNKYKAFINKKLNIINVLKKLETIPEIEEEKIINSHENNHGIKLIKKKINNSMIEIKNSNNN